MKLPTLLVGLCSAQIDFDSGPNFGSDYSGSEGMGDTFSRQSFGDSGPGFNPSSSFSDPSYDDSGPGFSPSSMFSSPSSDDSSSMFPRPSSDESNSMFYSPSSDDSSSSFNPNSMFYSPSSDDSSPSFSPSSMLSSPSSDDSGSTYNPRSIFSSPSSDDYSSMFSSSSSDDSGSSHIFSGSPSNYFSNFNPSATVSNPSTDNFGSSFIPSTMPSGESSYELKSNKDMFSGASPEEPSSKEETFNFFDSTKPNQNNIFDSPKPKDPESFYPRPDSFGPSNPRETFEPYKDESVTSFDPLNPSDSFERPKPKYPDPEPFSKPKENESFSFEIEKPKEEEKNPGKPMDILELIKSFLPPPPEKPKEEKPAPEIYFFPSPPNKEQPPREIYFLPSPPTKEEKPPQEIHFLPSPLKNEEKSPREIYSSPTSEKSHARCPDAPKLYHDRDVLADFMNDPYFIDECSLPAQRPTRNFHSELNRCFPEMYRGQGIEWADGRYFQLTGTHAPFEMNATLWASEAQQNGWRVSLTPTVPSIAVFHGGADGIPPHGHVAVVERVYRNGQICTSNWNYPSRMRRSMHIVQPNKNINFISKPSN